MRSMLQPMKSGMRLYPAVILALLLRCAQAQDIGAWKFGMSADEIRGQAAFGPYKAFTNGDLETYSGVFAGAKRNFQFYLRNGKLWRIAIRMYEGHDLDQATAAWRETYVALTGQFGAIETPKMSPGPVENLAQQARTLVEAGSKAQMAPVQQRAGEFVFSTFAAGKPPTGGTLYMVTVNIDPPPGT
jgi:hypothetical protein